MKPNIRIIAFLDIQMVRNYIFKNLDAKGVFEQHTHNSSYSIYKDSSVFAFLGFFNSYFTRARNSSKLTKPCRFSHSGCVAIKQTFSF